jgi:hypothetical protein
MEIHISLWDFKGGIFVEDFLFHIEYFIRKFVLATLPTICFASHMEKERMKLLREKIKNIKTKKTTMQQIILRDSIFLLYF